MKVNLKVRRFNPEVDGGKTWWQSYSVEMPAYATVLDTLIEVRESTDGTLALRCSCRSAVCGSCAMRINGQARLACKAKVAALSPREGQEIVVEPGGNLPVIKDLVVDMKPFWDKVRAVQPWLQPPAGPPPEREYVASNEAMLELAGVMNCIMCGACVMDCTVLEVDQRFLGPAALAKALRFVHDPRDAATRERLRELSKYGGIWDCTHCFYCVEVCPKHVAPMERILELRRDAIRTGLRDHAGVRHAESFARSVKKTAWLDELRLPIESVGFDIGELLGMAPVGLRALVRGKMPSPIHHRRPGAQNVTKLFTALEAKEREEAQRHFHSETREKQEAKRS